MGLIAETYTIGDWLTWKLGLAVLGITLLIWIINGEFWYRMDRREKRRRDA